jgi:transposase
MGDGEIAAQVGCDLRTVARIRKRYATEGLDRALKDAPRSGQPPKITERIETRLVAIACSTPPEGATRWTLTLLQERLIADKLLTSISLNAIHEHLRERGIKPWREKNVVHSDGGRPVH